MRKEEFWEGEEEGERERVKKETHLVPTRIELCTLTTPRAWTTLCAWPMTFITSSHEPSVFPAV